MQIMRQRTAVPWHEPCPPCSRLPLFTHCRYFAALTQRHQFTGIFIAQALITVCYRFVRLVTGIPPHYINISIPRIPIHIFLFTGPNPNKIIQALFLISTSKRCGQSPPYIFCISPAQSIYSELDKVLLPQQTSHKQVYWDAVCH